MGFERLAALLQKWSLAECAPQWFGIPIELAQEERLLRSIIRAASRTFNRGLQIPLDEASMLLRTEVCGFLFIDYCKPNLLSNVFNSVSSKAPACENMAHPCAVSIAQCMVNAQRFHATAARGGSICI